MDEPKRLERVTRIELVTKAWEAAVIPFHHTRAPEDWIGCSGGGVKMQVRVRQATCAENTLISAGTNIVPSDT